MQRLSRDFYARHPLKLAQELLGRVLYRQTSEGLVGGRIVEAEAYCGADDPVSHAYRRRTPRNEVMFGPPGHLYVYFTYGMHHCANVVGESNGVAGAVLLRAVEPLEGLDLMAARRGVTDPELLARGPARLAQAFGLSRQDNGADLVSGAVWVGADQFLDGPVRTSVRIGVREDVAQPWRFYVPCRWVSGPRRLIS